MPQYAAPEGTPTIRAQDLQRQVQAPAPAKSEPTTGVVVRTEKRASTFPDALPGEGLAAYAARTAAQTGFPIGQLGALLATASASPAGPNASVKELVDAYVNPSAYWSDAEIAKQNADRQANLDFDKQRSYSTAETLNFSPTQADFEKYAYAEPFDPQLWRKLPRNDKGQLDVSSVWRSWSVAQRLQAYACAGITGMSRADITNGNDLLARQLVNGTELINKGMSSQPAIQGPGPYEIPKLAKGDPETLARYGLTEKLPAAELRAIAEGILHRLNISGREYDETLRQWGV